MDFNQRLVQIAKQERDRKARIERLQAAKDRFYAAYIQPYDDQIADLQAQLDSERDRLKADALRHAQETGDTHIHNLIQYKTLTKFDYDRKLAQTWAEENAPQFVRIVKSLDVRKFETALRNDQVEFPVTRREEAQIALQKFDHLADFEIVQETTT